MKVYSIKPNDKYQSLLAIDQAAYRRATRKWGFDGQSKRATWELLECGPSDPALPRGDFFSFTLGAFICSTRAQEVMGDLYLQAGELLPVTLDRETLSVVNLTKFVDAIDRSRAIPRHIGGGMYSGFERWSFLSGRLGGESLFIVREAPGELLCVSEQADRSLDYFSRCVEKRLSGHSFKLLWESDGD
jgi:hypothetical protein